MKTEASSIEDFEEKAKLRNEKLIEIFTYVIELNGKYLPAFKLKSESIVYGRIIPKRFEKPEDVEDFIEFLAKKLSKNFYNQNFNVILRNLKYTKSLDFKKLKEEDELKYLMGLGYFLE